MTGIKAILRNTQSEIDESVFGRARKNEILQHTITLTADALEQIEKFIGNLSDYSMQKNLNFLRESVLCLRLMHIILKDMLGYSITLSDEFRMNNFHALLSKDSLPPASSSDLVTVARDWWNEVFSALSTSYARHNSLEHSYCRPFEVSLSDASFRSLMFAVDELRRGNVPAGVSRVQGDGAPNQRGDLRGYIRMANSYVRACKHGKISDDSPFETVSRSFGVNIKTARRWWRGSKEYEQQYFREPEDAEELAEQMRSGAAGYRKVKNLGDLEH